jgi:hypothetical protein
MKQLTLILFWLLLKNSPWRAQYNGGKHSLKGHLLTIFIIVPLIGHSQIENKIEGLLLNTPCELEYTRNIGNLNNYSCVNQDSNEKIIQYSVTVQNLFNEMNGLTQKELEIFKTRFFDTAKANAEMNNESTESIVLANGQKALGVKSYLTYSGLRFVNISIVFLYKQKSFIFNLTTNNLELADNEEIVKRIGI